MAARSGDKVTKSFAWSFLEQGGAKAIAMVVQVVLARILAPEVFGLLAILLVVVNIADSLSNSGLGTALIHSERGDDLAYTTGFWLSVGLAVVLYLVVCAAAPLFAAFYKMPELVTPLRVLSTCIIFNSANSIQRSYLQRTFNFKALFTTNVVAVTLSGIVGILVARMDGGLWALVAQVLSQSVFVCAVMLMVVPWKPTLDFDVRVAFELFSYGWKICATSVLGVVYNSITDLVLGKACTKADLGYYSQGSKYPHAAIQVVTNALQNVLFPAFSRLKGDAKAFRAALKKALTMGTYVIAPASIMFAIIAKPVVVLLLSQKWLPCVPVFQLTCISDCFLMVQLVNLRAYMALGDSRLYLTLQIIKVALGTVMISGAAILTHDIYAVSAAAAAFRLITTAGVDGLPARRKHGYALSQQMVDIWPIYAAVAVAAAASWAVGLISLPNVLLMIVQVAVFGVTYVVAAALLRIDAQKDFVALVRRTLRRG